MRRDAGEPPDRPAGEDAFLTFEVFPADGRGSKVGKTAPMEWTVKMGEMSIFGGRRGRTTARLPSEEASQEGPAKVFAAKLSPL